MQSNRYLLIKLLPFLAFMMLSSAMYAQNTSVNGIVTTESGEPIPYSTVKALNIKSQKEVSVFADSSGKFTFSNLPTSGTYSFTASFVGYITRTISGIILQADETNSVIISLKEDITLLEEIVVIGYGEQSRTKVIGSVGKIDEKALDKVTAPSIDQQLAGKMSGVVINQSDGQPGAASQIVIRGTGTLTAGSQPLIVVDGFPLTEGSSLNSINPNDIADISILKDAASAAIYGSRAANGVVLVSTKQGSFNEKTTINISAYTGFQQQASKVKYVDAYDHALFLKEARDWGYVSKDPANRSESDPNSVRVTKKINGRNIDGRELNLDFLDPYLNGTQGLTNTDWMDEAFRNAPMSNFTIAISSGNSKNRLYTSFGYFNQKGVVIGTDLQRFSGSLNYETTINKKLKFGLNYKPSFTAQNVGDQDSRSSGTMALLPLSFPYYKAYLDDGSYNISDQVINEQRIIEGVRINGTPVENLVATAKLVKNRLNNFRNFGNLYLNYEVISGLSYRFSLGGDYGTYVKNYYYPMAVGAYRIPAPRPDANASQTNQNQINYLVENTLTYKFGFNKNNFTALAGYTFQKNILSSTGINGTGFPDDNIQNISGASTYSSSYSKNIWTLESYFGRLLYDFDGKYLFSAALRRDGSSRFGNINRWGYFPSASAGWIISREGFFPKSNFLSYMKISGSWGQTGNNQIGTYGSMALVTNSNYVLGNSIAPGYISTTAPNNALGWEKASSLNFALDFGLFKDKTSLSIAYYKTNTTDLLLEVPVPQQTGYNSVLANIGEMQNQGLELQLTTQNHKIGVITAGFNANLTTYQNKVIALGPGQERIATGRDQLFVTQIGRPIAEIFGYEIDGIYKTQNEIDSSPHLSGTLTGDYKVVDQNKDGVIDTKDLISKGTFAPKGTYGLGADLGYKGLGFSFNFMGVYGRTLMDGDMASLTEAGEGFAIPSQYYFDNRYHPVNNPDGFLGQPNFANFSNSRRLLRSSSVVEKNNGNYLRLRDVRVTFDFPSKILNQIKVSNLQLYLSGNNLFTLTKYRSWNPDGTTSNVLTSGYNDGDNYPIARSYVLGVNLSL